MKEELDANVELDRVDDNNGDENPYRDLVVNNVDGIEMSHLQMEQWSILSNVIIYVQNSRNPQNFHIMTVKLAKLNKIANIRDNSKTLPKCYVQQCYRCVNLKGCLGVRCPKCKCECTAIHNAHLQVP